MTDREFLTALMQILNHGFRRHFLTVLLALSMTMIASACSSQRIYSVEEQVKYGDYAAALPTLNERIKKDRKNDWLFTLRGHANAGLGRHKEAIEDFSAAIKLTPKQCNTVQLLHNRGTEYLLSKDFQNALEDFTQCRKLDPVGWGSMSENLQSKSLFELGKYSKCIQNCSATLKSLGSSKNSSAVEAFSIRSRAYRALGKAQLAESDENTSARLAREFYPNRTR